VCTVVCIMCGPITLTYAAPLLCVVEAGGNCIERQAQQNELAWKWHNEKPLAEKQEYPCSKVLLLVRAKSKDVCGAVNQSRS